MSASWVRLNMSQLYNQVYTIYLYADGVLLWQFANKKTIHFKMSKQQDMINGMSLNND